MVWTTSMELSNETTTGVRVTADLSDIEFLCVEDTAVGSLGEADRGFLLSLAKYDECRIQPGTKGVIWRTPEKIPEPSLVQHKDDCLDIEFGGASEVFNSLTSGQYKPGLLHPPFTEPPPAPQPPAHQHPHPIHPQLNNHHHHHPAAITTANLAFGPTPPAASLGPQHIHINNFTANLNYHHSAALSTAPPPPIPPHHLQPSAPPLPVDRPINHHHQPPRPQQPQHHHHHHQQQQQQHHQQPPLHHHSRPGSRGPIVSLPGPFIPPAPYPGNYVAPFPTTSQSPPVFSGAPPPPPPSVYHPQMLVYPPPPHHHPPPPPPPSAPPTQTLHMSMFPPNLFPPCFPPVPPIVAGQKSDVGGIMFGSTPFVSVKHSSSDDESIVDEAKNSDRPESRNRDSAASVEAEPINGGSSRFGQEVTERRHESWNDMIESEHREEEEERKQMEENYNSYPSEQDSESETICDEIAGLNLQKQERNDPNEEVDGDGDEAVEVEVEVEFAVRAERCSPAWEPPPPPREQEGCIMSIVPRPTPPPFPHLKLAPRAASPGDAGGRRVVAGEEGVKSWASLFSPTNHTTVERIHTEKPTARIPPFSSNRDSSCFPPNAAAAATTTAAAAGGAGVTTGYYEDRSLGEFLRTYQLNHVSPSLLPRGLTNRSNWCFVNAILQSLVACPPFYNLMKSLPGPELGRSGSRKSVTPMMDSIARVVNEFLPLEAMTKVQKRDKTRRREDLPMGPCFEPSYVYRSLLELDMDTFKVVEGRQEDAEEFLTCLLNKLSDEMQSLMKLSEAGNNQPESGDGLTEWLELSSRGVSCITRRVNQGDSVIITPIQKLASGLCRSSVRSANSDTSATLQPFFALQLDIQSPSVHTVTDALRENFTSEALDGYICTETRQQVEANRTLSLEELPPVLILHLKRMVYDGGSGCIKVMKWVDFSIDLEMNREILSVASKTRYTQKERQYKLFSVVYHNGLEASKGHYVADVYHTGYSCWLRCDDTNIRPIDEQTVTSPSPGSAPYILFYRRGDTMVGTDKGTATRNN